MQLNLEKEKEKRNRRKCKSVVWSLCWSLSKSKNTYYIFWQHLFSIAIPNTILCQVLGHIQHTVWMTCCLHVVWLQ